MCTHSNSSEMTALQDVKLNAQYHMHTAKDYWNPSCGSDMHGQSLKNLKSTGLT